MEPSLRHRGDLHVPLARVVGVVPGEHTAPNDQEIVLDLGTAFAVDRNGPPWRPTRARAGGLLLGQRIGEVLGGTNPAGWPTPMSPGAPRASGPSAQEAEILGAQALRGRLNPRRLALALATGIQDPEHPLAAFARSLRSGGDWRAAGAAVPESPSLARAIPLAIVLVDDDAALVSEAITATIVTHRDIRAATAAITMVWVAREAMGQPAGQARPVDIIERLAARARSVERVLIRRLNELMLPTWRQHQRVLSSQIYRSAGLVGEAPGRAFEKLVESLPASKDEGSSGPPAQRPEVAVPMALLLGFAGPPRFEEALRTAAAIPGGGGVLCGLVGAIVGARAGREGIPGFLHDAISGSERIWTLARALAGDPTAIRENR